MESNSYDSYKRRKNASGRQLRAIGWVLIVLAIIVIAILFLTRGKTTITGEYPGPENTSTLICVKKGTKYPKITDADSDDKEISITAIFNGSTSLRSIALTYTLAYDTEAEVKNAEALASFDFIGHLGGAGMDNGEFNNKISIFGNNLEISVYGDSKDLESEDRAGYFMLGTESATKKDLSTLAGVRKAYEKKGFSCESSEDSK